jgi:hypothetical protein
VSDAAAATGDLDAVLSRDDAAWLQERLREYRDLLQYLHEH